MDIPFWKGFWPPLSATPMRYPFVSQTLVKLGSSVVVGR